MVAGHVCEGARGTQGCCVCESGLECKPQRPYSQVQLVLVRLDALCEQQLVLGSGSRAWAVQSPVQGAYAGSQPCAVAAACTRPGAVAAELVLF